MNTPSLLPEVGATDDAPSAKRAVYGLGISVRGLKDGGMNLWHTGSLPGTSALAVRTADGFAWVVAFNGRPRAVPRSGANWTAGCGR